MRTIVIITLSLLLAYNIYRIYKVKQVTSVSMVNGKYRIDSFVIAFDKNLDNLLTTLEKTQLSQKALMEEVPGFIKKFLVDITKDSFKIANPKDKWNATDVIDYKYIEERVYDKEKKDSVLAMFPDLQHPLPFRKLYYFGVGDEIAVLYYHTGGIGEITHVAIFKFSNEKVIDFWIGYSDIFDDFNKEKFIKEARSNVEHYHVVHI